jgi:hypothetical protein
MFFRYSLCMLLVGEEMVSNQVTASKDAVLFPDELEIVDVVGERFDAGNWFKYMSDRLKEKRSVSESLSRMKDSKILEK